MGTGHIGTGGRCTPWWVLACTAPLWSGGLESGGCERRMVCDSEGMEYGSSDPLNNDPLNNDHSDPIDEIFVCKIFEEILGGD